MREIGGIRDVVQNKINTVELRGEVPEMNYLHYDMQLQPDDIVEVTLDKQANVRLLDDVNYVQYQQGKRHQYYGGLANKSPVRLSPPHGGHWHLVVDLGGNAGTVKASVRTIKGQS